MPQNKFRPIRDIVAAAGGNKVVATAISGGLTADAVYKWQHNGIPDRYWSTIIPMAETSAEEIFAANEAARAEKAA